MPISKWNGAKEPTIGNFYKIDINEVFNMPLTVRIYRSQSQYFISTEVNIHKYYFATNFFGDLYGPPAETHTK